MRGAVVAILEGLSESRNNLSTSTLVNEGVVEDYLKDLKTFQIELQKVDYSTLQSYVQEVKNNGAKALGHNTPGDWKFTYTTDIDDILKSFTYIEKETQTLIDHIEGKKQVSYRDLLHMHSYSLSWEPIVGLRRGVKEKKLSDIAAYINKAQDIINKFKKFIYTNGNHCEVISGLIKAAKLDLEDYANMELVPQFTKFNKSDIKITCDHTGVVLAFTDSSTKLNDVKRVVKDMEQDTELNTIFKSIDCYRAGAGADKGIVKVRFIQR